MTPMARPASSAARALVRRLPWFALCGAWFIVWQLTTVKTNLLRPPYFAAPEVLIAALVEDPGSAQRVSRALKASGLVADVLRADAPVAGARVVG